MCMFTLLASHSHLDFGMKQQVPARKTTQKKQHWCPDRWNGVKTTWIQTDVGREMKPLVWFYEVFSVIRGDMKDEGGVMRQDTGEQIKMFNRMRTAKQKEAMPAVNPQAVLWSSVSDRLQPVTFVSYSFIRSSLTCKLGQTELKLTLNIQK